MAYSVIGMLRTGGLGKDMTSGVNVPYMNEAERAKYRVTVQQGMLWTHLGVALDTQHISNKVYIFVMDQDGRIFSSAKSTVEHHSAFLSGRPVAAAGCIGVENGVVCYIDNQSGHYQPTRDYMLQFVKELEKGGVDMTDVETNFGATTKQVVTAYKKRGMKPRERLYTPEKPRAEYF